MDFFFTLEAPKQALLAGIFTWLSTAAGAAFVFFVARPGQKLLDVMLGFAGGVMVAASFWSLLSPAVEISRGANPPAWVPATVGFLIGGAALRLLDMLTPHLHPAMEEVSPDGPPSSLRRATLLALAITLHNIPEGLAVGVAFGAAGTASGASLSDAVALSLGMGLQNFPEGLAVSMPLRREGLSCAKAFFYGQLSAIVEPIFAFAGAMLLYLARPLLPWALAFAAGAMMFVVVEETVPESHASGNGDIATSGFLIGFAVMTALDVALG